MIKSLAVLSLSAAMGAAAVYAEAPAFNLDRSESAAALVKAVRQETAKDASPVKASPVAKREAGFGCRDFSFTAKSPDASEPQTIWGFTKVWTCRAEGNPPVPRCQNEETPFSLDVRIVLRERKPLTPSETEVFRVCMDGERPRWEALSTVYEYHDADGGKRGDIVLAAGERKAKP